MLSLKTTLRAKLPQAFLPGIIALLLPAVVRADVTILDQPGSSFSSVQAAVDAASDGDTLLIAGGSYAGFTVDGKGLSFIASPGVTCDVLGAVVIRNLPAQSTLQIDRLNIAFTPSFPGQVLTALELDSNNGAIRIHDCEITGVPGPTQFADGGLAVHVTQSLDVAFLNCVLDGGDGDGGSNLFVGTGGAGANGLLATDSTLALYDCVVTGGAGGTAGFQGGDGADGCNVSGLSLFAAGCSFTGGDGGEADDFIVLGGGDGGTGLWAGLGTEVRLMDNEYLAGAGGPSNLGTDGSPGVPNFWEGGALNDLPGTLRRLRAEGSVIADGNDFHLVAQGLPGDRVSLAIGRMPTFNPSTQPAGVKLVRFNRFLAWGAHTIIGPSGTVDIFLSSKDLPNGGWQTITVQADIRPAGGGKRIGSAVVLTSLDDETGSDCNMNGQVDLFDIASGLESDCNGDFVPDSCFLVTDCNNNGVDDSIDIQCGFSTDNNSNGVLDECENNQVIFVDSGAAAGGDGSLEAPFQALAEAFAVALEDWTIEVAEGVYSGPSNRQLSFGFRSFWVKGIGNPIIDVEQQGSAFLVSSYVLGARITGLTIINASDSAIVVTVDAKLTLENCTLRDNTQAGSGAALFLGGNATVVDCSFLQNSATGTGSTGGAIISFEQLNLLRCNFRGNTAEFGGAVSKSSSSVATITHCIFRENTADYSGGAIQNRRGTMRIDNSYFSQNAVSTGGGGAIWNGSATSPISSTMYLTSCTLVNNTAGSGTGSLEGGGALFLAKTGRTSVRNSIFWNNTASSGGQIRMNADTGWPEDLDIAHTDLQGGVLGISVVQGSILSGANVLDQDPLFMDPLIGDYRLGPGSPCIDSGTDPGLAKDPFDLDLDGNVTEAVPVDILGSPRQKDDPLHADTGVGAAPITDMGALER